MARTAEADALTDDYRRRQAQLGAYMLAQLGRAWPILDPRDVAGTREPWLRAIATLVAQGYNASAALAAAYVPAYRALERVPGEAPNVPLSVPNLRLVLADAAYLGPIRHAERLRGGADPDESWRIARNMTIAAAQQRALDGGRDQTVAVAKADRAALGWSRVCGASACHWCAMLAGRGPVYKSERTASFQAHPGCNCAVELVYHEGREAWTPAARVFGDEWDEVTKGYEGADKALVWRRHHEGRDLDPATGKTTDGTAKPRRGRAAKRYADPNDAAVRAASAEHQLGTLRANLARLEARKTAGEDVDKALDWQRQRIAALEAELGPEATARATAAAAERTTAAAVQAAEEAALAVPRVAAQRADAARQAAQRADVDDAVKVADVDADRIERRNAEAALVQAEEERLAAQAAKAADGAELDDQGHPWRLTVDYLEDLDDDELEAFVDYCAEGVATDNPLELARFEDLELWLDYRDAYNDVVAQAGNVADNVIDRELAELMATRGRVGLTHRATDVDVVQTHAATSKPTRRQVQQEFAVYLEELYIRAEDATRGVMVNNKGEARGVSGYELLKGDVRRLLRYGSEELLEFFEDPRNRRVQFAEFYAERTGSRAFADLAAKQRDRNARIDRDRNGVQ